MNDDDLVLKRCTRCKGWRWTRRIVEQIYPVQIEVVR